MNAVRRLELQASLQRELDRQEVERGLNSTGRVVWLLDQVENYLERWLGLRAVSANTPSSDELFGMIEIGAEVTSAELHTVESRQFAESWQKFLAVLAEVGAGSSTIEPQKLAESLSVVRSELLS